LIIEDWIIYTYAPDGFHDCYRRKHLFIEIENGKALNLIKTCFD